MLKAEMSKNQFIPLAVLKTLKRTTLKVCFYKRIIDNTYQVYLPALLTSVGHSFVDQTFSISILAGGYVPCFQSEYAYGYWGIRYLVE